MAKKKLKLTKAEREEWEIHRRQMLANARRTRELAERAQAKLDQQKSERA
jgi:competence protein ComGF